MSDTIPAGDDKARRLELLLSYLEADPGNASLTADAIDAALEADDPDLALRLLGGGDPSDLGDADLNRLGLIQLRRRDHGAAAEAFSLHVARAGRVYWRRKPGRGRCRRISDRRGPCSTPR